MKLLFKSDHGMRYDSFLLCNSRLKNLFNGMFRKDPGLFKCNDKIIKDKIYSSIVERAAESHIVGEIYYFPRNSVVQEENTIAKLQIVFNACVKANKSHNLNDCLYPRLSLIATLFGVLLQLRIQNSICWRYREEVSQNGFRSITLMFCEISMVSKNR